MNKKEVSASAAGNISHWAVEISVHRLGFGAMRLTGEASGDRQRIAKEPSRSSPPPWNSMSISSIPRIPTARTQTKKLIAEALFPIRRVW